MPARPSKNTLAVAFGPIATPDLADCIWAAGFFDGEGCVNMTRATKSGHVKAQAIISNCELSVLEWYRLHWGGAIYASRPGTQRQPAFQWQLSEARMTPFLEDVRPFLKIKTPQTDNCLAYLRLRAERRKHSHMSQAERQSYEPFLKAHRELDLTHGGQAPHAKRGQI